MSCRRSPARILAPSGMVVGLKLDNGEMFERLLEEQTIQLGAGDLFVFFTDGISEAMNSADDCFGEVRLGQLLEDHADLPSEELRERVLREVRSFVGRRAAARRHDDDSAEGRGSAGAAGRRSTQSSQSSRRRRD